MNEGRVTLESMNKRKDNLFLDRLEERSKAQLGSEQSFVPTYSINDYEYQNFSTTPRQVRQLNETELCVYRLYSPTHYELIFVVLYLRLIFR